MVTPSFCFLLRLVLVRLVGPPRFALSLLLTSGVNSCQLDMYLMTAECNEGQRPPLALSSKFRAAFGPACAPLR
jgi:hypothetical protein